MQYRAEKLGEILDKQDLKNMIEPLEILLRTRFEGNINKFVLTMTAYALGLITHNKDLMDNLYEAVGHLTSSVMAIACGECEGEGEDKTNI